MTVRIILADDHKIIREGLCVLLGNEEDFDVVAEAENGREVIELARKLKPDVVIMDVAMPELNGVEAARLLHVYLPHTHIVALSMHADKRYVNKMLQSHAKAYLPKDCASEELVKAIRAVMDGKTYISSAIQGGAGESDQDDSELSAISAFMVLTSREREVLQLLAEGNTTKGIANTLGVSAKTIETHRLRMMNKLGVHSVAELTKYALREGLTSLDM